MDMLDRVVRKFIEIDPDAPITPYGNGHINDTYLVEGREESYLLQRINHQIFHRPQLVMSNISKVASFLRMHQYEGLILDPIRTRQGELLHIDKQENYWRLFPFFSNTYSIEQVTSQEEAQKASEAFSSFLESLATMDAYILDATIQNFHDSLLRLKSFEAVCLKDPIRRALHVKEEIAFIRQEEQLFKEVANLKLPSRVTHNDTKINNILFDTQTSKARGVIDWDTIMAGSYLYDFGDMVRTMAVSVNEEHKELEDIAVNELFFEGVCAGFIPRLKADMKEVEQRNLLKGVYWICLVQAMRFLTDFISGDHYYKIQYEDQNLWRARNQIRLYKALREKEEDLESIIQKYIN